MVCCRLSKYHGYMFPECKLVRLLTALKDGAHNHHLNGLERVAQAALNIIRDAHNEHVSDYDAQMIAELILEIHSVGFLDSELLTYLEADSADCGVCRAVAQKFNTLSRSTLLT